MHSAGRLPRPLVAPLRSKSLGARAGRSRSRAHDRDRSRHRDDTAAPRRSPRRSTAPRRWWNRSDLVGQEELPEATRIPRFQPALDARSPSLIPCTQSCKRSRLKKFFSPGRACCSDCLKVRRPPPLLRQPLRPIPPVRDGRRIKKKRRPHPPHKPAPRRIADISPHPETFPDSADASDRARSGSRPSARRKPSSSARRWRRRLGRRRRCSSSRTRRRRRRRRAGGSLPGRSLPPRGIR